MNEEPRADLPQAPIDRLVGPLTRFLHVEAASGVVLLLFTAATLVLASLPEGVGWGALLGGGFLAGIGFTMALFISELALDGAALNAAKVGVLAGSAVAAIIGVVILIAALRPKDA